MSMDLSASSMLDRYQKARRTIKSVSAKNWFYPEINHFNQRSILSRNGDKCNECQVCLVSQVVVWFLKMSGNRSWVVTGKIGGRCKWHLIIQIVIVVMRFGSRRSQKIVTMCEVFSDSSVRILEVLMWEIRDS